jgi:hypothetical protein
VVSNWDAATWAAVVLAAFTGVIATGVVFAWIQLRDSHRTRDAEIVQHLMGQWDSPRMIEARRLIASYRGPSAVEHMTADFIGARSRQTGDYFLFTYHLNFWEQVGIAYGDNRDTLRLIDTIFGDELWRAWANWQPVLVGAYGPRAFVGSKFEATFGKLQKRAKWKLRRRDLRLWLLTPYYNVPIEERRARRRRWMVGRT